MRISVEPDRAAVLDGIELEDLHRLRADTRIWTLTDVQAALHISSRYVLLKLWRCTCNYLYGGHREWPPLGEVRNKRLPDVGTPVEHMWWPPYDALLPPPDLPGGRANPRWYAGTIMTWAVQVGRLRLPDLAPVKGTSRGGKPEPSAVDLSGISLARLEALVDDDNLWTVTDIEKFFEVKHEVAQRWVRAVRNRLERGVTSWPPTNQEARQIVSDPEGTGLTWWPSHHRLLPPPNGTESGGRRRFYGSGEGRWWREGSLLWKAGAVKKWGLEVGRLQPDGTVVHLHGQ